MWIVNGMATHQPPVIKTYEKQISQKTVVYLL